MEKQQKSWKIFCWLKRELDRVKALMVKEVPKWKAKMQRWKDEEVRLAPRPAPRPAPCPAPRPAPLARW